MTCTREGMISRYPDELKMFLNWLVALMMAAMLYLGKIMLLC